MLELSDKDFRAAIIKNASTGAWLVQLVEHTTRDLRVVSLSPTLGTEITLTKKASTSNSKLSQKKLKKNRKLQQKCLLNEQYLAKTIRGRTHTVYYHLYITLQNAK